jgi:hypothetical protein
MAKFRKLPVTIDAVRYDGTNLAEIEAFIGQRAQRAPGEPPLPNPRAFHIATLEGGHIASLGDWIVKGIAAECYPVKDAIFRATYQAVDGEGEAALTKVVAAS